MLFLYESVLYNILLIKVAQSISSLNIRKASYTDDVWSPYYKQDIEAIERVRLRFSKRLRGLKELTYEERLKFLGWPYPRITSPAYCYKIMFGLVYLTSDHFFSNSVQIKLESMALSYINSLALVLCVHLSLLTALLTCGTVCRLLLILVSLCI